MAEDVNFVPLRWEGQGEPENRWTLLSLKRVRKEIEQLLNPAQLAQIKYYFALMCQSDDPCDVEGLDYEKLAGEDFYESRFRNNVFNRLNIRVYYLVDSEYRRIVILKVYQKAYGGQLNLPTKQNCRARINEYQDQRSLILSNPYG
jgi:hypothetical protein